MCRRKLKMVLATLLSVFMVIAFTISHVSADDINAMTQQLLSSGQVEPDIAARVNTYEFFKLECRKFIPVLSGMA